MELIKISDQRLKIMLTPLDLTEYDLNEEQLDNGHAFSQSSFRRLLSDVRSRLDFAFEGHRLSVQYFPSRMGGGEMFLCSLPEEMTEPSDSPSNQQENARTTEFQKPIPCSFVRDSAYRFEELDALLAACHRLRRVGYIGESEAFRDDARRYYLLIRTPSPSPFTLPPELEFLCEYGQVENPALLRLYFREHGAVVCAPNAVEKLAGLK